MNPSRDLCNRALAVAYYMGTTKYVEVEGFAEKVQLSITNAISEVVAAGSLLRLEIPKSKSDEIPGLGSELDEKIRGERARIVEEAKQGYSSAEAGARDLDGDGYVDAMERLAFLSKSVIPETRATVQLRAGLREMREAARDIAAKNIELAKIERDRGLEVGSAGRFKSDGCFESNPGAGPGAGHDPNDPRGPWQLPGAPADRTGGTKARPGGSEGGDGRREGAAPPKPESWADRHSGPVWEGKGRGGDGTMGRTATRSQGGPKAEDRREGKAPERLDKHGRKESDPKFVGPQPVLLDLDGNGVKITEYHNATRLMTGKDGLRHRSSWAGAGDGVLFCDPDVRSAITERRQHVFTEWNPTAAGDPEAGRTGWRRKCPRWTNADGCLGSTGWQRTSGTWEGYGSRGFGGAGAAGDARSPGG